MKFVSHLDNPNLHHLQQWTGERLAHMTWLPDLASLAECRRCVVIIDSIEANYRIAVTQQLIDNDNFLVFCDFFDSAGIGATGDLLLRVKNLQQWAVISSGDYPHDLAVNLNEYYHSQLIMPNQFRARTAWNLVSDARKKPYTFLYRNGRARLHRRQLYHALDNLNCLDRALYNWNHYSFDAPDFDPEKETLPPLHFLPIDYESPYADLDRLQKFRDDRRKMHRHPDICFRPHWSSHHVIARQFEHTYFSVVAEADVEHIHISEHTYNALLVGHPVLALAAPGYLARLQNLGFETWHPMIDESYDQEPDWQRRCELVSREVARLCNSNLDNFADQLQDRCDFNRRHYIESQWTEWFDTHLRLDALFEKICQRFSS